MYVEIICSSGVFVGADSDKGFRNSNEEPGGKSSKIACDFYLFNVWLKFIEVQIKYFHP